MRKIYLAESTLSASAGMSFGRRLECARLLDDVNIDVICVCPMGEEKSDEILIKTIARQTKNAVVSVPVTGGECEKAFSAVKDALRPRLAQKYISAFYGNKTEYCLKQFAPAVAQKAGEAQYLALPEAEGYIREIGRRAQAARLQNRIAQRMLTLEFVSA